MNNRGIIWKSGKMLKDMRNYIKYQLWVECGAAATIGGILNVGDKEHKTN